MSNSRLSPTTSIESIPHIQLSKIQPTRSGRLSPPPMSSSRNSTRSFSSLEKHNPNKAKPQTDEERLSVILQRISNLDPTEHERRGVLLNSAILFMKLSEMSSNQLKNILDVLLTVFSIPPPFSVITKSYRQIYFHPKDHEPDIKTAYKIFKMLLPLKPNLSEDLLHSLMRRLTSASTEDRIGAQECLKSVDPIHHPLLIHILALTLIPPPPHGTSSLLELAVHFLTEYKAPPPLFDDFFITTSFDDSNDILSITSPISEPRLRDGITIFEELQCSFQLLHFAPHYQSFSGQLLEAMKSLHNHNEDFAHQNRRFLLNHWPRNDPQKAVLFMKEATAICVHGPPPEEYIWQRFSHRSSSIQWQIAMESLNFISQTIQRSENFDNQVLIFLLDETIKNHWNNKVKEKAQIVRKLFPENAPKHPPKSLPRDTWTTLKNQANQHFPKSNFPLFFLPSKKIVKKS